MWRNKLQQSPFFNILLAVAAGAMLIAVTRVATQAYQIRRESTAVQKETELLNKKRADLGVQLQGLATPEAVQRQAKERLNLKLPDEQVVVVVPPAVHIATSTHESTWNTVKQFLKSIFH